MSKKTRTMSIIVALVALLIIAPIVTIYIMMTGKFSSASPVDGQGEVIKNYEGDKNPFPVSQGAKFRNLAIYPSAPKLRDEGEVKVACMPITLKNVSKSDISYGPTNFFLTVDGDKEKYPVSILYGTQMSAATVKGGEEVTSMVCLQSPKTLNVGDSVNIHYSVNQFSKNNNISWKGIVEGETVQPSDPGAIGSLNDLINDVTQTTDNPSETSSPVTEDQETTQPSEIVVP